MKAFNFIRSRVTQIVDTCYLTVTYMGDLIDEIKYNRAKVDEMEQIIEKLDADVMFLYGILEENFGVNDKMKSISLQFPSLNKTKNNDEPN